MAMYVIIDGYPRELAQVMNALNVSDLFPVGDDEFFSDKELYDFAEALANYISEVAPNEIGQYSGQRPDVVYYLNDYLGDDFHGMIHGHDFEDLPECDDPIVSFVTKSIIAKNESDTRTVDNMMSKAYVDNEYSECECLVRESDCRDAKDTAEKCFENGNTHGFSSVEDMVKCAKICVDECGVDYWSYDAGLYGIHNVDGTEDYGFEVFGEFLGNSKKCEESKCLPLDFDLIPCAKDYVYFGEYVYARPTMYILFAVKWSDLEEKGKELGLIGGEK